MSPFSPRADFRKERCCKDCWQTCLANQGLLAAEPAAGAVICREDGCRCACILESSWNFSPLNYPSDTARAAIRKCTIAHEEYHVRSPRVSCDCGVKPCLSVPVDRSLRKDEECFAAYVEITCLQAEMASCGGDAACVADINTRIGRADDHCASLGGDWTEHIVNP